MSSLLLSACGGESSDSNTDINPIFDQPSDAGAVITQTPQDDFDEIPIGQGTLPDQNAALSQVSNGFYVSRTTTSVTDMIDSSNNFESSTEYSLNNDTNTLEATTFRNGVVTSQTNERFSVVGNTLSRTSLSADGTVLSTNNYSYGADGFIEKIAIGSDQEDAFTFVNGVVRTVESSFEGNIETFVEFFNDAEGRVSRLESSFIQPDFSSTSIFECNFTYESPTRTIISCSDFIGDEANPRLSSEEVITLDANGNHVGSVENFFELVGSEDSLGNFREVGTIIRTVSQTYEYTATSTPVPNVILEQTIYYPGL